MKLNKRRGAGGVDVRLKVVYRDIMTANTLLSFVVVRLAASMRAKTRATMPLGVPTKRAGRFRRRGRGRRAGGERNGQTAEEESGAGSVPILYTRLSNPKNKIKIDIKF